MRKISIIFIIILLIGTVDVFAGDASGIFMNEKAAVFFGEVVSYDKTTKIITVIPTQKIKGDVEIGIEQTHEYLYNDNEFLWYGRNVPNRYIEDYILEEGAIFVMGYGGYGSFPNIDTRTSEIQETPGVDVVIGSDGSIKWTVEPDFDPTFHLFQVTSTDTRTLKIILAPGVDQVYSGAVQEHLNRGDYERAEIDRLERLTSQESSSQSSTDNGYPPIIYISIIVLVLVLLAGSIYLIMKKRGVGK